MCNKEVANRKVTDFKCVEFIESYIKRGNGDYEWFDNHGELIRCRDCRWWDKGTEQCSYRRIGTCPPNWFCADGERKCEDA